MLSKNYQDLHEKLIKIIDSTRIITDPLRLLAYGTDASFYRLIPKIVIFVHNEHEVQQILKLTYEMQIPITFRAAGTSLSGQAITDSVLIVATHKWRNYQILENAEKIVLQPGIIGARANAILVPFGRKIGPDPASINAAMIGGIASNNASGMCCGVAQNSYKTIEDIRIILADGTILDTRSEESCEAFKQTHVDFLTKIENLRDEIKANSKLSARISHKYKIKNTTGFSINSFIDFDDPFDIIKHLIIGSEGTLAFISNITYKTVIDEKFKSCALVIFKTIEEACKAVPLLKNSPVSAVELLDRKSLRSVESDPDAPDYFKTLPDSSCALLIECQANDEENLKLKENECKNAISQMQLVQDFAFTSDPREYNFNWKARKGLLASVGGMRKTGTTCLIEDVAFPIENLAKACTALEELFKKYNYDDAYLFGHALEGNLHLVFSQNFTEKIEIERYANLMNDLVELVVNQFDGSLKAEHGTGRNMAPFVEKEWGNDAYSIMLKIKQIFDEKNLLNPGVILNTNANVHLENLKPLPQTDEIIDKCIECGFCEPNCVSEGLTLSPRQRIVISREIQRLKIENETEMLNSFQKKSVYDLDKTCAADGLCEIACPVGINTGKFVKKLRAQKIGNWDKKIATYLGNHFEGTIGFVKFGLNSGNVFRQILGDKTLGDLSLKIRKLSKNHFPIWRNSIPFSAKKIESHIINPGQNKKVIYFPACLSRVLGKSAHDQQNELDLMRQTEKLLTKAGFTILYPQKIKKLCCGMAFESRGMPEMKKQKQNELEEMLWNLSENGNIPILFDTSPCFESMIESLANKSLRIFDPIDFMLNEVLPILPISQKKECVTVFPVCSVRKANKVQRLVDLAKFCSKKVNVIQSNCCGFAGDKGFFVPEVNQHGLRHLNEQILVESEGIYSTSRTCEMGLSDKSGRTAKSIIYLINDVIE